MSLDTFPHPLRERHGRVEDRSGKEHNEFLAAVASHTIDLPCFLFQERCELLQHRIPGVMSVFVVHALEAIQVAHDAGQRFLEPLGVREHLVHLLLDEPPVLQARQAIRA